MSDYDDMIRMLTRTRSPYTILENPGWVTAKKLCVNSCMGDHPTQFNFDANGSLLGISWYKDEILPRGSVETRINL